jgi:hypothetical protein
MCLPEWRKIEHISVYAKGQSMHAENYGAIWKHEWINFASSLTQDGSSLLNIQTNLSSALNIEHISVYAKGQSIAQQTVKGHFDSS